MNRRLERRCPSVALAGLFALFIAPVVGAREARGAPPAPGAPPAMPAATPSPMGDPPPESLRAVEERGKLLADYFEALSQAQEQVRGQSMPTPDAAVVIKSSDGLRVVFVKDAVQVGGRKSTMEVAESAYDPTSRKAIGLSTMAPPTPAPAAVISYARALQQARERAAGRGEASPPFDEAVIRERDNSFSVYLRSRDADGPGGDLLATIAATGRQIVDMQALHHAVTHLPAEVRKPGQATLHSHTESESELPTATDVALVIRRPALAPHLVLTPRWMFRIDAEGRITYLGPNPVPASAPPSPGAAPAAAPPSLPPRTAPMGQGAPHGGERP